MGLKQLRAHEVTHWTFSTLADMCKRLEQQWRTQTRTASADHAPIGQIDGTDRGTSTSRNVVSCNTIQDYATAEADAHGNGTVPQEYVTEKGETDGPEDGHKQGARTHEPRCESTAHDTTASESRVQELNQVQEAAADYAFALTDDHKNMDPCASTACHSVTRATAMATLEDGCVNGPTQKDPNTSGQTRTNAANSHEDHSADGDASGQTPNNDDAQSACLHSKLCMSAQTSCTNAAAVSCSVNAPLPGTSVPSRLTPSNKRFCVHLTRRQFLTLIRYALVANQRSRKKHVKDFVMACQIREHQRGMTILFGGTSGSGKSTLASLTASRLGIPTVLSTDFIRHMLRKVYTQENCPLIYASTYNAGLCVPEEEAKNLSHEELVS
jgi:hypothetical protein